WNYTAGGTDPAPLRRGSELDDGLETSSSLSPVGVGVSLASHWLSRELPQHRANQNHRLASTPMPPRATATLNVHILSRQVHAVNVHLSGRQPVNGHPWPPTPTELQQVYKLK
ncbi:hypothetical protein Taro_000741, partial [Colocasia esculenta]|nr:hypothetical protein [Colocasia esculenta]